MVFRCIRLLLRSRLRHRKAIYVYDHPMLSSFRKMACVDKAYSPDNITFRVEPVSEPRCHRLTVPYYKLSNRAQLPTDDNVKPYGKNRGSP